MKRTAIMGVILALILICMPFTSSITLSNQVDNVIIPYQEGWPQTTLGEIYSSPVIADLDNDGKMEIIVGSGGTGWNYNIYVFHHDGTIMDGWPIELEGLVLGSPAVGDIDNDGDLEIILGDEGAIYAWHHTGQIVNGWPMSVGYLVSTPTLYDLDNDGNLEIIVGGLNLFNGTECAVLYIWRHDGTTFGGWPQIITDYDFSIIEYSSPAVGDLDNDDDYEIIVGLRINSSFEESDGAIFAWHHTGQIVDGWPVHTEKYSWVESSPVLCDLDDDVDLEIIVGTLRGKIFALHDDGTFVNGWPSDYVQSWMYSQGIADIDQDGELEIISTVLNNDRVYVWESDGTLLDGWPQKVQGRGSDSPIIGDIYGDDYLEVIASHQPNKISAWHHNGTIVPGFPLTVNDVSSDSTPCLGDIDNDGDVELIYGSGDKNIYVWDLPTPFKEEGMEWPMFQHDLYHTGNYGFGKGFTADANGPYYGRIGTEIEFKGSALNGEPPYSWHWDFGDGNTSTERNPTHIYNSDITDYMVNLTITDSRGDRVFDVDHVEVSTYGRIEYGALEITSIVGGIGVSAVVENNGIVDANGVCWSIMVDEKYEDEEGAILIPRDGVVSGWVDIPAGKSRMIWCPILEDISFKPWVNMNVIVTVEIENCTDQKTEVKGALLFFVI